VRRREREKAHEGLGRRRAIPLRLHPDAAKLVPRDLRIDIQLLGLALRPRGLGTCCPSPGTPLPGPSSGDPTGAPESSVQQALRARIAAVLGAAAGDAGAGGRRLSARKRWQVREELCWHSAFRRAARLAICN